MESLEITRASVYALRRELTKKTWTSFDGDKATLLVGFQSPEIPTELVETVEVPVVSPEIQTKESRNLDSPEIQTPVIDIPALNPSPKNQTASPDFQTPTPTSPEIHTKSPEIQTEKSRNLDSHIRKNQQKEPAKEPEREALSLPDTTDPVELFRAVAGHTPPIVTQTEIESRVQDAEVWRETLRDWKLDGYGFNRVGKLLSSYDEKVERKENKRKRSAKYESDPVVADMPKWRRSLLGFA